MDDFSRFSRMVFLAPFRSKTFWAPLLAGVGLMSVSSGLGFVVGAATVAAGIGTVVWKWTIGRRRLIRQVSLRVRQLEQNQLRQVRRK